MKLYNALISMTDNYDLPVILIDELGKNRYYPSIRYLIGLVPHSDILKNFDYINGCCQLDLNGEDNFSIIYVKDCKKEV